MNPFFVYMKKDPPLIEDLLYENISKIE